MSDQIPIDPKVIARGTNVSVRRVERRIKDYTDRHLAEAKPSGTIPARHVFNIIDEVAKDGKKVPALTMWLIAYSANLLGRLRELDRHLETLVDEIRSQREELKKRDKRILEVTERARRDINELFGVALSEVRRSARGVPTPVVVLIIVSLTAVTGYSLDTQADAQDKAGERISNIQVMTADLTAGVTALRDQVDDQRYNDLSARLDALAEHLDGAADEVGEGSWLTKLWPF